MPVLGQYCADAGSIGPVPARYWSITECLQGLSNSIIESEVDRNGSCNCGDERRLSIRRYHNDTDMFKDTRGPTLLWTLYRCKINMCQDRWSLEGHVLIRLSLFMLNSCQNPCHQSICDRIVLVNDIGIALNSTSFTWWDISYKTKRAVIYFPFGGQWRNLYFSVIDLCMKAINFVNGRLVTAINRM